MLYLGLVLAMRVIGRQSSQSSSERLKSNWLVARLQHGFVSTKHLETGYQKLLAKIIANSRQCWLLLGAIGVMTVVAFALPVLGLVQSDFFPKEEADFFELSLTLPTGTSEQESERVALEILPTFADMEGLDYVTAQIGSDGSSQLVSGGGSANKILFTFNLVPKKKRSVSSIELAAQMRHAWAVNPYGRAQVNEDSTVSAGGADIQMYIVGDDLDILAAKAEEMMTWLKAQPGVMDVASDINESSKRLVFKPQPQVVASYGLSNTDFAIWLRTNLSGWSLGTLRQDGKEIDITLRQQQETPTVADLEKIQIPVSGVGYMPLTSLGEIVVEPSPAQITRYAYQHAVAVTAAVEAGYSSTQINSQFENFIDNELDLPVGYGRYVGGMQKMNQEAMGGLYLAMGVAGFLILITLVLQLRSFRKAFIVMSVIPVAISGVFLNFALVGISLTLPAVIGVLALFGIVVNNSILIVERINQNLDAGKHFVQSVVDGCTSRLQPILLTSLTTIVGLIPITLSDPLWQGLGGAIIAGLAFSGVLLLLYIPAMYVLMFAPERVQASDKRWQQRWRRWAE